MEDMTKAKVVQVSIIKMKNGSHRLWVNVDNECKLRAYRIEEIFINDVRFSDMTDTIASLRL